MARQPGSKNVQAFAYHYPTRCAGCGSTDRTKYKNKRTEIYVGFDLNGQRITHIERCNTSCKNCFKSRIDITYHNRPTGKAKQNAAV